MIYYRGCIIVAYQKAVRFIEILAADVTSTVEQFMNIDLGFGAPKNDSPVLESKQFTGKIFQERVFSLVYNHLRDEVVCVCVDASNKLVYYTVEIDVGLDSEKLKLTPYKASDYSQVPPLKFDLPKMEP
jgi:hypothetical protein